MKALQLFLLILLSFPQQWTIAEEAKIFQTLRPIQIDGTLNDWEGMSALMVEFDLNGNKVLFPDDIEVKAWLSFDEKRFLVGVEAQDNCFEFPERSWRYGDGFYLTFVDIRKQNPSNYFYSFGFSIEKGVVRKILVNKDGEYFPRADLSKIEFNVRLEKENHRILYEAGIPFENVFPFKPFLHQKWGINLIYIDRDQRKRKILQLFPDRAYDTEKTNLRNGLPFDFIPAKLSATEPVQIQTAISSNLVYKGNPFEILIAVNSPGVFKRNRLLVKVSREETIVKFVNKNIPLYKHLNKFTFPLELRKILSGKLTLQIQISGEKIRFSEEYPIFFLNLQEIENFKHRIEKIKNISLTLGKEKLRAGLPIAESRLKWVSEIIGRKDHFIEVDTLAKHLSELKECLNDLEKGNLSFSGKRGIFRLAHRSKVDDTLQPYSVFIPEAWDGIRKVPLLVMLHGSGVDERNTIQNVKKIMDPSLDWIVLAPKARGLSDWYLGDSGKDVIECIESIKNLYPIDENRIALMGFSMGGYGTWRIGLTRPHIFTALAVLSGALLPWNSPPENEAFNFIQKEEKVPVLAYHGDRDNAVPVEQARIMVKKLKEAGYECEYREIKGAGHGDYLREAYPKIIEWLKKKFEEKQEIKS